MRRLRRVYRGVCDRVSRMFVLGRQRTIRSRNIRTEYDHEGRVSSRESHTHTVWSPRDPGLGPQGQKADCLQSKSL